MTKRFSYRFSRAFIQQNTNFVSSFNYVIEDVIKKTGHLPNIRL